MRAAHTVEQVRAAEAGPDGPAARGTLMQRAAAGLAQAVARPARRRRTAAGCCCSSGRGTTAATRCTPARCWPAAGAASRRCCCRRPGARRRARPRCGPRAAGSVDRRRRRTPDVVVDGIVGIGGRPGCGADAVAALGAARRGPGRRRRRARRGVDVDTGRLDGPHVAPT